MPRTTTQRGLGWQHQKQVLRLKQQHRDTTPCWWCAKPMYNDNNAHLNWDGHKLHGDHSTSRDHGGTITDRLLHQTCNIQRGNGDHDDQRPALLHQHGGHPGNTLQWAK